MNNKKQQEMAKELSVEELESVTGGATLATYRSIKLPTNTLRPVITRPINGDIFA